MGKSISGTKNEQLATRRESFIYRDFTEDKVNVFLLVYRILKVKTISHITTVASAGWQHVLGMLKSIQLDSQDLRDLQNLTISVFDTNAEQIKYSKSEERAKEIILSMIQDIRLKDIFSKNKGRIRTHLGNSKPTEQVLDLFTEVPEPESIPALIFISNILDYAYRHVDPPNTEKANEIVIERIQTLLAKYDFVVFSHHPAMDSKEGYPCFETIIEMLGKSGIYTRREGISDNFVCVVSKEPIPVRD